MNEFYKDEYTRYYKEEHDDSGEKHKQLNKSLAQMSKEEMD